MKRKLRVVLDVVLEDLPTEKLQEHAREMVAPGEAPWPLDELDGVKAIQNARTAVDGLDGLITGEAQDEWLWAGSDLFVRFTDCRIASAEWVGEVEP